MSLLKKLNVNIPRDEYRKICFMFCFESQMSRDTAFEHLKAVFPEITPQEVDLEFERFQNEATMATSEPATSNQQEGLNMDPTALGLNYFRAPYQLTAEEQLKALLPQGSIPQFVFEFATFNGDETATVAGPATTFDPFALGFNYFGEQSLQTAHEQLNALFPKITPPVVDSEFTGFNGDETATVAGPATTFDPSALGFNYFQQIVQQMGEQFIRFQNGNIEPEKPFLKGNPVVIANLLSFLGAKDLQNVRLVSRSLNRAVRVDYKKLSISLNENKFEVGVTRRATFKRYLVTRTDTGCTIDRNGEMTTSDETFMEEGLKVFKENVEKKGMKIERMVIHYDGLDDAQRVAFFNGASSILGRLRERLGINKLDIHVHTPSELKSILNNLNGQLLTDLNLRILSRDPFDLSEIASLSHWSHLNNLSSRGGTVMLPLNRFGHIAQTSVSLSVESSPEDIVDYVKSLIKFPGKVFHCITTTFDAAIVKRLLEPYGVQHETNGKAVGRIPLESGGDLKYTIDRATTQKWLIIVEK